MRNALLALLTLGPSHGYELKQALERNVGKVWRSVNIGQIYTTLQRLERDGLIREEGVDENQRGKRTYNITEEGRAELKVWMATPTVGPRLKDEFFTKFVLAAHSGIADPLELIEAQRNEYLQALRELHQAAETDGDLSGSLLIEGSALHLQADLTFLDRCEEQYLRSRT